MSESIVNSPGTTPRATEGAPSSAAEIVQGILTAGLTLNDRVLIIRALRDSFPELVPVDARLVARIRNAAATSPEFIDSTVNGLENYKVWQDSSSASPEELRRHREYGAEHRPMIEALQAFVDVMKYNVAYQHFVAVDKSRRAYKVGKAMSGEAGLSIRAHLAIIAQTRPGNGRKRKKTEEPATGTTPPVTPVKP
jgi:hypothetical protein